MKERAKLFFYILLAVLMVIDLYLIFNAGNPDSIIRPIVRDPGYDIIITVIISVFIMGIANFVFKPYRKEQDKLYHLLQTNKEYIKKLKEKGKSDSEISESLLTELKLKGLSRRLVKRRILKYLPEFE